MSPQPTSVEAAFATNLKLIRGRAAMTQAVLAEKMSRRGFKWHPATVHKIENGDRQIQLGEALEVAKILGQEIAYMTRDHTAPEEVAVVRDIHRTLKSERTHLLHSLDTFAADLSLLADLLSDKAVRAFLSPSELDEMGRDADPESKLRASVKALYHAIRDAERHAET